MKRRTTLRECEFCKITSALKIRKCCAEGMKQDMTKSIFILVKGIVSNGIHSPSFVILKVSKTLLKLQNIMKIEESTKHSTLKLKPHLKLRNCWVNSIEYYEIIEKEMI